MANLKTREQLEARQQFIERSKKDDWKIINGSPKSLKGLSIEQLEDSWQSIEHQLDAITDQGRLMQWFILKNIRDKFKSTKLFGQHLQELADSNPTHALSVVSQQTRTKWINAANWCEYMKIYSLPEVKISQTAVFLLSSPAVPLAMSKTIFKQIRDKNSPVSEIERLINQHKAITVEPLVERIEYNQAEAVPLRIVPVENNIALEPLSWHQETIFEPPAQDLEGLEPPPETTPAYVYNVLEHRKAVLLESMPELAVNQITQEQMVEELLLLISQYRLSEIKLIPVLQAAIRHLHGVIWKKPS